MHTELHTKTRSFFKEAKEQQQKEEGKGFSKPSGNGAMGVWCPIHPGHSLWKTEPFSLFTQPFLPWFETGIHLLLDWQRELTSNPDVPSPNLNSQPSDRVSCQIKYSADKLISLINYYCFKNVAATWVSERFVTSQLHCTLWNSYSRRLAAEVVNKYSWQVPLKVNLWQESMKEATLIVCVFIILG